MRVVSIILLTFFNSFASFAQEEPYYKDLSNRNRDDLRFLPNLDTKKTRLYFTGELAFRFLNSKVSSESSTRYETNAVNSLNYGGTVGVNFSDNWYFDLGIDANPMGMQTILNASISGQRPIRIATGQDFTAYGLTVRKKVWQIDKVTNNAAMLITAGLKLAPALNNNVIEDRLIRLGVNSVNGSRPDTANYRIITRSDKLVPIPQLGFEISGKVVEQVEIGLFTKMSFMPDGILTNDLIFRINSDPNVLSRQAIGKFTLDFGVIVRWNLINWVNYKTNVK